jgi:hypothetical protein
VVLRARSGGRFANAASPGQELKTHSIHATDPSGNAVSLTVREQVRMDANNDGAMRILNPEFRDPGYTNPSRYHISCESLSEGTGVGYYPTFQEQRDDSGEGAAGAAGKSVDTCLHRAQGERRGSRLGKVGSWVARWEKGRGARQGSRQIRAYTDRRIPRRRSTITVARRSRDASRTCAASCASSRVFSTMSVIRTKRNTPWYINLDPTSRSSASSRG